MNYVILNKTGGIFKKIKTNLNFKICEESDFYHKHKFFIY